jgi:hypothetical protein
MASSRRRRWGEEDNAMKERKKNTGWQNNTEAEKLKRRDHVAVVAVTRLRTGYSAKKERYKDERVIWRKNQLFALR